MASAATPTETFRGLNFVNGTVSFTQDENSDPSNPTKNRRIQRSETETLTASVGDTGGSSIDEATEYPSSLLPAAGVRRSRRDVITVFQSAPLVWRDGEDGTLHPIERPDFDREREMLRAALRDAALSSDGGIDVGLAYETATTDRLGAVLASPGGSGVLHFSCHGLPDSLVFEDGTGGSQFIDLEGLRDLVSSGSGGGGLGDGGVGAKRGRLRLVFVAACHSLPAASAFLRAGAARVVCCRRDEPLRDSAASEFARSFYRALACGRTVRESFESARGAVRASPNVGSAADEADKFMLLPEDGDHDAILFGTPTGMRGRKLLPRTVSSPLPFSANLNRNQLACILPQPPQFCIGREVDIYRVVQGVLRTRLVQLTGSSGIGKGSVAAAACAYISERCHAFAFDSIYWLPLLSASRSDDLAVHLQRMFDLLRQERGGDDISLDEEYRLLRSEILEDLHSMKSIVVIDTNDFLEDSRRTNLSVFLLDIFRGTRDVRVIIVSRYDSNFDLWHNGMETKIALEPLDFATSATLFGAQCPHVTEGRYARASTPHGLRNILIRSEDQGGMRINDTSVSSKSADLFRRIGGGIPSQIYTAARSITTEQFSDLLSVASRPELRIKSRIELERKLTSFEDELRDAVDQCDYDRAKEVHGTLDELRSSRPNLPGLDRLRKAEIELDASRAKAVEQKDFERAGKVHGEMVLLKERIEEEEKALRGMSEEEAELVLRLIVDAEDDQCAHFDSCEGDSNWTTTWAIVKEHLPSIVLTAIPISLLLSSMWIWWWDTSKSASKDPGISSIYTEALKRNAPAGEHLNGRQKVVRPSAGKFLQFWRQIMAHAKS
uniref:CHAT domain-containing protein n=1 Tax=Odontella aurita TaxID=265563 RepID=A0A7S4J0S9_9STRA